ncbi:purine nucleoside permease [Mesobaculum littorinae]|uniref:Purine nucleoside permease n=1 Tax=Mesobaculum littorinae TaxID=2486419 RepID=A0A438AG84_9RHOB|nr:purine nucleoside permease [Mesobaculum littorinae]RVV97577.1 purine nucleoside permease [Mesobaculum littorinae]
MPFRTALLAATTAIVPLSVAAQEEAQQPVAPKVLVITMFAGETQPWQDALTLDTAVAVPGLPASAPELHCNEDLCVMTTTMGFANAAASVAAVALADEIDLSDSYVVVAGIGGVDPEEGTLGSAHWARYVVDGGLRHQIDPREIPQGWTTGAFDLGTAEPGQAEGGWSAGTEVYALNADLAQRAFDITRDVALADGDTAAEYRATYTQEAAQRAPFVSLCDTVSADTYWHGAVIAAEVEDRVAQLTDGAGTYCTTQMEDNATLAALERADAAGRVQMDRVAVLRTGSNFDRPAEGQTAAESLASDSGGFGPATENAFRVANAFAETVIADWETWKDGVPAAE